MTSMSRLLGFICAWVCLLCVSICPRACASALAGSQSLLPARQGAFTARQLHLDQLLTRAEESPGAAGFAEAGEVLTSELPAHPGPARRTPPGVAFLMSAAVPGAGQFLQGRNRAFAYMGLEAIAWIAHFAWKDAGNKKEGEYEAYARNHWDLEQWNALASESSDTCRALPPGVNYADAKATIESFLESGNYQHYYEDIGKLEAYRAGWDDFSCSDPESMSSNRREYRGMRADSNDYLDRSKSAVTVVFLNHIISAVDAYRIAKGAQLSVADRTSLELKVGGSIQHPRAVLRVRRIF